MKKKLINLFTVLFFVVAFAVLFSACTLAYIDPSVMTYAIQATAGIVIALGAALGMYFRSAKKKIGKKLGVDENKNKEVESDDILISKKEEPKKEEPKKVETKKDENKKEKIKK